MKTRVIGINTVNVDDDIFERNSLDDNIFENFRFCTIKLWSERFSKNRVIVGFRGYTEPVMST